ncbi:MAG: Ig-like domain-containing protein [Myxococcaceae bacterium]|nr:Ig-like domain-containing protein [Myxococcaceae bacterium]
MYSPRGNFSTGAVLLVCVVTVGLGAVLTACPPTGAKPCDTDADCPDGRCRFGACGPICEEDGDCGDRQVCQNGACVSAPECAQNADCASGFECREGRCACTGDDACALNQACVDGHCQTRARCTSDASCPPGQRCEVTQGLCIPPCAFATDCAPGLDPRLATALYQCTQGTCFRRCINDVSCGAAGLICSDGLCTAAQCHTRADCPAGQYCTSATFGRCAAFQPCTSTSECGPNFECRAFDPQSCPPGFDCTQSICQELPRCLVDDDCRAALPLPGDPGGVDRVAYCAEGHCQPSKACAAREDCPTGMDCVAKVCVPGGCRGHVDCANGQACVEGVCRSAPAAIDVAGARLTPLVSHVPVGGSVQLHFVAWTLDGASFPSAQASFSVVGDDGQPSTAASVDATGRVTGVSAGKVTIRAVILGSAVLPISATVYVHAPPATGRKVVVIDAATREPLAGTLVRGCDGPMSAGPCTAPVEVMTDAVGEAAFPAFSKGDGSSAATFTVAAADRRPDGLPQYERVSFVDVRSGTVLVPLGANPVRAAAGFNGTVSFTQVHSDGAYWVGFGTLSAGDPSEADLRSLLGETFWVDLPGLPQKAPVPGSVVLYTSPGLGIPSEVKGRSLGLGQPGRRTVTAFAGRTSIEALMSVRSTDFLAWVGAMDYTLLPFNAIVSRAEVPDTVDVDNDGLCSNAAQCPQGPERVPDYFNFTPLTFTPHKAQRLRTEVVLPDLPPEYDTAVVAVVSVDSEAGVAPLGFVSRAAGPPDANNLRPVDPVVMRSGAPHGGVEMGQPGVWVMGVQAASLTQAGGGVGGRILRGNALPTRAVVAPLLPSANGSTVTPGTRTFAPAQPQWNTLVSEGGELARVDLFGADVRHRIYFEAQGSQTLVSLPEAPTGAPGNDPVAEAGARLEVTVIDLLPGVTSQDAFDLGGADLSAPATLIDGYSRWQGQ